jgi:hypothetical protein
MSRLLFAAARGARIGWQTLSGQWCAAFNLLDVQSEGGQVAYRIHPDDEHLQYGPISKVLRERAGEKHPPKENFMHDAMAGIVPNYIEGDWAARYENLLHRSLFLLFLAEALADEGM